MRDRNGNMPPLPGIYSDYAAPFSSQWCSFLILGSAAGVAFLPDISFAQPSAPTESDKVATRETDVSKWTRRKWNAAKAK
jgi:hypothetical protein